MVLVVNLSPIVLIPTKVVQQDSFVLFARVSSALMVLVVLTN
jgi:hypothetical protein